eukprot:350747-Chlamydomonas_euryale.AAC.6
MASTRHLKPPHTSHVAAARLRRSLQVGVFLVRLPGRQHQVVRKREERLERAVAHVGFVLVTSANVDLVVALAEDAD